MRPAREDRKERKDEIREKPKGLFKRNPQLVPVQWGQGDT